MPDPRAESSASDLADIDLTNAELYRHGFPHEIFTRLRGEAPVHWQPMREDLAATREEGFWVLSKYEDIQAANRDSELFSAIDGPQLSYNPEIRGIMMLSMDGREHTHHRKLISSAFTPRMVGRLEQRARVWAISIVEDALKRGTCNFVEDVAYQLPMHMIADIMGIPVEDRAWLFKLAADFLQASDPESDISLEQRAAIQIEMFQYALYNPILVSLKDLSVRLA